MKFVFILYQLFKKSVRHPKIIRQTTGDLLKQAAKILRISETEFLCYLAEWFICIYQPLFSCLETLELKVFFVRLPCFIFQQIIEICGRKTKNSDALLNSGKIGGLTLYSIEMIIQKTVKPFDNLLVSLIACDELAFVEAFAIIKQ